MIWPQNARQYTALALKQRNAKTKSERNLVCVRLSLIAFIIAPFQLGSHIKPKIGDDAFLHDVFLAVEAAQAVVAGGIGRDQFEITGVAVKYWNAGLIFV